MTFRFFLAIAFLCIISFTSAESNPVKGISQKPNDILRSTSEIFYSQSAQDKFVYLLLYKLLNKQDEGYYLEIGSGEPIYINNSYFFEEKFQWSGVSIDISPDFQKPWSASRKNPLLIEDATKTDYDSILKTFPSVPDYLSLDVDGSYDIVLERIPLDQHLFKIITIEHDFYRYGDKYRKEERRILTQLGYYLLCPNVRNSGLAYEDWWIHPSAFPSDLFFALSSLDLQEKEFSEIIQLLETVAWSAKDYSDI